MILPAISIVARSVAANAHAVGVFDDDLSAIHGLDIVLARLASCFLSDAILVGRDLELALVGEMNAFALRLQARLALCILTSRRTPKVAREFALALVMVVKALWLGVIL